MLSCFIYHKLMSLGAQGTIEFMALSTQGLQMGLWMQTITPIWDPFI